MKPMKVFLFALMLLLVPLLAYGETQYYSISDLPSVTSARWKETYQAYGRTIDVDVKIEIPDVAAAPVLLVRTASPISETITQEIEKQCEAAMKKDKVNSYSFKSTNFVTSYDYGTPPQWGKTQNAEYEMTMSWDSHLLLDYSMDKAYAEDNDLLLGDAVEIAQRQIEALYHCEKLKLTNVATFDRTFYKKNKKKISEKGYYHLEMHQVLQGIPFMASVQNTFSKKGLWNENLWIKERGRASADVWGENSFLIGCWFYEESDVLYQDVPLLSFDELKYQVEELINKGYVRDIFSVNLGYVQFDTENGEEQALVPAWVVWCEYQQEGPRAERTGPLYNDGWLEHEPYYRPLIISAQTGKMIDPENTEEGRCMMPEIMTW